MVKVIGKNSCSRCDMVKNILTSKSIAFEYELLEDMTSDDKSNYLKMARAAKQLEMPLIIVDNKIVKLTEVM